jgi:hypothetical protein
MSVTILACDMPQRRSDTAGHRQRSRASSQQDERRRRAAENRKWKTETRDVKTPIDSPFEVD